MIKTIRDVIHILKTGERQGAETDEPEGARYIVISETLVNEMIEALVKSEAVLITRHPTIMTHNDWSHILRLLLIPLLGEDYANWSDETHWLIYGVAKGLKKFYADKTGIRFK